MPPPFTDKTPIKSKLLPLHGVKQEYTLSASQPAETHTLVTENITSDILRTRFATHAQPHEAAYLGTTFQYGAAEQIQPTLIPTQPVLDNYSVSHYFGNDGVLVGISAAVADGLGHAFEPQPLAVKEQFSRDLATATTKAAKQRIDTMRKSAMERLLGRTSLSDQQKYKVISSITEVDTTVRSKMADQYQDSTEAACASVDVFWNDSEKKFQALCTNVGDTMIVIVHQDRHVTVIPAAVYDNYISIKPEVKKQQFSPESTKKATMANSLIELIDVTPGDMIFLMSDGVWEELILQKATIVDKGINPNKATFKVYQRLHRVEEWTFRSLFSSISHTILDTPSTFAAALYEKFLEYAALTHQTHAKLAEIVRKIPTEKDQMSLAEWLNENEQYRIEITSLIQRTEQGDGFTLSLDNTIADFKFFFASQKLGDDATLLVIEIPHPHVEIIRRLVETFSLDHNSDGMSVLNKLESIPQAQRKEALQRLAIEKRDGNYLYTAPELMNVAKTILIDNPQDILSLLSGRLEHPEIYTRYNADIKTYIYDILGSVPSDFESFPLVTQEERKTALLHLAVASNEEGYFFTGDQIMKVASSILDKYPSKFILFLKDNLKEPGVLERHDTEFKKHIAELEKGLSSLGNSEELPNVIRNICDKAKIAYHLPQDYKNNIHILAACGCVATLNAWLGYNNPSIAEQLTYRNAQGETPLHVAAKYRQLETLVIFLNFESDVNLLDSQGATVLHLMIHSFINSNKNILESEQEYLRVIIDKFLLRGFAINSTDSLAGSNQTIQQLCQSSGSNKTNAKIIEEIISTVVFAKRQATQVEEAPPPSPKASPSTEW